MRTLLLVILCVGVFVAEGQDGQASFKLGKLESLHETVFLGDEGLIVKYGQFNEKQPQQLQLL